MSERSDAERGGRNLGAGPAGAPVVAKMYDLTLWYLPTIAKFRRDVRFTVGERLVESLLDAHDLLTSAAYGHDRREALRLAGRRIDRVRLLTRLAHDLGVLDHRRYDHASERVVEVGRMVGGWLRASRARGEPGRSDDVDALADA